jgi:hypothetical protein
VSAPTLQVVKWAFPFFIITIVTNHGHAYPVAMFLPEHETGASIAEALAILREWNPDWKPQRFMLDKDQKEETAVNEAFHDCGTGVLLCDFHRYQAWWRNIMFGGCGCGTTLRRTSINK